MKFTETCKPIPFNRLRQKELFRLSGCNTVYLYKIHTVWNNKKGDDIEHNTIIIYCPSDKLLEGVSCDFPGDTEVIPLKIEE